MKNGVRSFIIRFLQALFANGMWPVKGTRSYLHGYLSADSNSKVDITGGFIGQDSGISVRASAASGTARVRTIGGTFSGAVSANNNSFVKITDGTFGKHYAEFIYTPSVVVAPSVGEGIANISGGNFDDGVLVNGNGYARISGGSFGRLGGDYPDFYSQF